MIEVSYMEFIRNTVKYTNAVVDRGEQVIVNRNGMKFYVMDYQTIDLIKTALVVASTSIDSSDDALTAFDSA